MYVYFSLGTNLGNKEQNLRLAVQYIEKRIGKVISLRHLLFICFQIVQINYTKF